MQLGELHTNLGTLIDEILQFGRVYEVLGRFLSSWDERLTVGANFGLRECLFTSWANY
jgi:hypothetical protein